jgi:hypothetical protein
MLQIVADKLQELFLWPELSVVLKSLKDPRLAGMKEWLTDRYDNCGIPDSVIYRNAGKKTNTPPIVSSDAPRISLLATSSADWFIISLEQGDSTGGFIPRWTLFRRTTAGRPISKPQDTDESLIQPLADHFLQLLPGPI